MKETVRETWTEVMREAMALSRKKGGEEEVIKFLALLQEAEQIFMEKNFPSFPS